MRFTSDLVKDFLLKHEAPFASAFLRRDLSYPTDMEEHYKGYRINIERPALPQFNNGPLRGGIAQTWKVRIDGKDMARHIVKRKMDTTDTVLDAAKKYVDRLPVRGEKVAEAAS